MKGCVFVVVTLTDLFDWDAAILTKFYLFFFGKIIPHLTATGQKHEALNHLLHKYCFDVDGTLRMKGKHLCAIAETRALTAKTP